jgi:membrane protein
MIWLYIIAIAVLIGAALNASFDQLWPESGPQQARIELVRRLRRASLLRMRRHAIDGDGDHDGEHPDDAQDEDDLADEETMVLRRESRP